MPSPCVWQDRCVGDSLSLESGAGIVAAGRCRCVIECVSEGIAHHSSCGLMDRAPLLRRRLWVRVPPRVSQQPMLFCALLLRGLGVSSETQTLSQASHKSPGGARLHVLARGSNFQVAILECCHQFGAHQEFLHIAICQRSSRHCCNTCPLGRLRARRRETVRASGRA
jgi:hypothetical protein